ncbi:hypothetical protein ACFVX9_30305 [Kitasatospora sp. NPDC058243]|uniref:hypothetical protein n=1 Tax=Kitasatospora sp. NPDC058243 TaxID=3346397 RepID=UPI0036D86512
MTVRSAWHLNPGQSRQDTRLSPVGTMVPLDATQTRSGVLPGGTPLALTMSAMTATIATGRAVVQGTATQGAYPVVVSAAETVTIAPGHASLDRIDTLWIVAYDQLYDTSGLTAAAIAYTQGTPSSTPTAPTAPATGTAYLRLWDVRVPAGASAGAPPNWVGAGLLTDRRVYTASLGGITPDGGTMGAYAGQYRDGGTATGLERYTGTAWESRVYLGPAGQVVIGTDVNLYRNAANQLKTDDDLAVGGAFLGATNLNTGGWTSFVPTWTCLGAGAQPSLGNGTLTSKWCRIGRTIHWAGQLLIGSSTGTGSGLWFMSLPTPQANDFTRVGSMNLVAAGNNYIGEASANPADTQGCAFVVKTPATSASGANVGPGDPLTIAAGHRMLWSLTYEAAS